jgi:SAM-dependent methyltransferase
VADRCIICREGRLSECVDLSRVKAVTSDCKPWDQAGPLLQCGTCRVVQKKLDEAWRDDCQSIYTAYEMYTQGKGAEQAVFAAPDDRETLSPEPRSQRLLNCLFSEMTPPANGVLADIGCGNGGFLKVVHDLLPSWKLVGVEWDSRNRETIEALPGVIAFHEMAEFSKLKKLDIVSMIHAFEHMENPPEMLEWLAEILKPDGMVIIEVPDWRQNPFDLLIRDHAFHYSPLAFTKLFEHTTLNVLQLHEDWVPKELSLVAGRGTPPLQSDVGELAGTGDPAQSVRELEDFLEYCKRRLEGRRFNVFGTAIGAAWMAAHFDHQIAGWIDEDPARIGGSYLSRQISAPADTDRTLPVVIPLAPAVSKLVGDKLSGLGFEIAAQFGQDEI